MFLFWFPAQCCFSILGIISVQRANVVTTFTPILSVFLLSVITSGKQACPRSLNASLKVSTNTYNCYAHYWQRAAVVNYNGERAKVVIVRAESTKAVVLFFFFPSVAISSVHSHVSLMWRSSNYKELQTNKIHVNPSRFRPLMCHVLGKREAYSGETAAEIDSLSRFVAQLKWPWRRFHGHAAGRWTLQSSERSGTACKL